MSLVLIFPGLLFNNPNVTVNAAEKKAIPNDFNSLTLTDRSVAMFQTYNAKLTFLGEAYTDKQVQLAFAVTGATTRLGFAYKAVLTDGSHQANVSSSYFIFDPDEVRYYPNRTVYIFNIPNPKNAKLYRLQYSNILDADREDDPKDKYKSIPLNATTKTIFLPAIKGTAPYSIPTNYAKTDTEKTVKINKVTLQKTNQPLSITQEFSIWNTERSYVSYILEVDATTTLKEDNLKYNAYGSLEIPSMWKYDYSGDKESLFRSDYPKEVFSGLPIKDTYKFNVPKSIVNMASPAVVTIQGISFLIDLKTGKQMAQPAPVYPFLTRIYTNKTFTYNDGVARVNARPLTIASRDDEGFTFTDLGYNNDFDIIPLNGLYKTLTFNLSHDSVDSTLHDAVLNIYSDRPETYYGQVNYWTTPKIPTQNLIQSIVITKNMKPQNITVNLKGAKNLYIGYFGKLDKSNEEDTIILNDLQLK